MTIPLVRHGALALVAMAAWLSGAAAQTNPLPDPLPSWNDGPAKQAIIAFVADVTRDGSPDFVPPSERIATFDDNGTLWVEQPVEVQLAFTLDRVKALAPLHPEWRDRQPFKAALGGDVATLRAAGQKATTDLIAATHADMTPEEFRKTVREWLATARHPRYNRRYDDLVFQPMLDIMAYLRASGFKTVIVSSGDVEFVRAISEARFGVPPEQIVGSTVMTRFARRDGRPTLFRLPQVNVLDSGAGRPVGIDQQVGRRPIAAFGNSDGDLETLQWTTMAGGRRLGVLVHHTDAQREYAYDRQSGADRLDRALEAAAVGRWTVVDVKRDWKILFAFAQQAL